MARMELLVAAAVAMGASLALADGAVSRSSGSGGGSSSTGSSGGSVSSSSSSSSSGGSSWSGGSSSSAGARSRAPGRSSATSASRAGRGSPATPAQARQPRPGPGYRGGHSGGPYYPGHSSYYYGSYPYGYGLYGNPWFGGIGWGSSYWSAAPGWGYWGYYDPFFYGYYAPVRSGGGGGRSRSATEAATVRLISDPEDAAVIVDERQVGVVSDFDDLSERLRLSPGSHEIVIRRPGYVTHRVSVYLQAGEDLRIRHFLDKGTGETMETIGTPPPKLDLRTTTAPSDAGAEPSRERQDAEPEPLSLEPATLTVQVDPEDASIYVNGRFEGTSDEVTELVLPPGPHTVEVVRPGFRSTEVQVALEAGKDKTIEVKLQRP